MIARLRARHRRVWIALVVVAPVVVAAAASVRRAPAVFTELPPVFFAETTAAGEASAMPVGPEIRCEWYLGRSGETGIMGTARLHWLRADPSGRWLLESDRFSVLTNSDPLLYWAPATADEVQAFEHANRDDWEAGLTSFRLPGNAALLGAWPSSAMQRFAVPDALAANGGQLILYGLHAARVEGVSWIGPAPQGGSR